MVTTASSRRTIVAPNFAPTEGACACGCGLLPADSVILGHQALVMALTREYQLPVRILVTGGVRCMQHHLAIYQDLNEMRVKQGLPVREVPMDSRHLPPHLDALDTRFQVKTDGRWTSIPLDVVALWARKVGVFGGIGLNEYQKDGRDMIHLDCRPGRVVSW